MRQEGVASAFTSLIVIGAIIVSVVSLTIHRLNLIGPMLILLGFVPWIPVKVSGRTIRSAGADMVFGAIDTGFLGIAALIGASLAGVLGAIVGGAVGDSITGGMAGIFEGRMAEKLRERGIDEARTPLSASMGKMSGCLIGVGIVLTVAWTVLQIELP